MPVKTIIFDLLDAKVVAFGASRADDTVIFLYIFKKVSFFDLKKEYNKAEFYQNKEKALITGLFVALIAFILDQISKYYVFRFAVQNGSPFEVCDYFNIVSAFNKGVSFSMLDGGGMWGRVALVVFALAVVFFLLRWMKDETSTFVRVSLGLIIGGAMGNVADRLRLGAVYDFLDLHVGIYHWPAFNVADSFICIGAFLIVIHTLFSIKKTKEKK